MDKMTYMKFIERKTANKTKVISVENNEGLRIGVISWHSPWRKYVFEAEDNTIFDEKCLEELTQQLSKLREERKFINLHSNHKTK